jgi:hypothetical protein
MCEKCEPIDERIAHYLALGQQITDQQTLEGIKRLIANLETQNKVLHPEE